jgi:hypothetical protein
MIHLDCLPVVARISLNRFTLDEVLNSSTYKRVLDGVKELVHAGDFAMPPVEKIKPEIDLVLVTPECFGFHKTVGYCQFLMAVQMAGFRWCPDETGLVYFESYDRVCGELIEIADREGVCFASRLIKDKNGAGVILQMKRGAEKTLSTRYAEEKEGGFFAPDQKFFVAQTRGWYA